MSRVSKRPTANSSAIGDLKSADVASRVAAVSTLSASDVAASQPEAPTNPQPEILIVVATGHEVDYIDKDLPSGQEYLDEDAGVTEYQFKLKVGGGSAGRSVNALLLKLNRAGEVHACAATMRALLRCKMAPKLAVNIGISGTLSSDVELCHVVIGEIVKRYMENTRVVDDTLTPPQTYRFIPRQDPDLITTKKICNLTKNPKTGKDKGKWVTAWTKRAQKIAREELGDEWSKIGLNFGTGIKNPKHHTVKLASGPFLVDSAVFKSWMVEQVDGSLKAVDMESGGFTVAIDLIPKLYRPSHTMILRGISDRADGTKRKTDAGATSVASPTSGVPTGAIRQIAMRRALAFLVELLSSDCVNEVFAASHPASPSR